jgi:Domain of unknown function DUF29
MAVKEQRAELSNVSPDAGYDADFFQWTQSTAELIRQGRLAEVDLEHVAEEIEDMGKRDRREVRSRFSVLIMHLLKWQLQPKLRERSTWRATIREQRKQLRLVLADSPSLGRIPKEELPALYRSAVEDAVEETGLRADHFPSSCPYTVEQTLDGAFFPEGR